MYRFVCLCIVHVQFHVHAYHVALFNRTPSFFIINMNILICCSEQYYLLYFEQNNENLNKCLARKRKKNNKIILHKNEKKANKGKKNAP